MSMITMVIAITLSVAVNAGDAQKHIVPTVLKYQPLPAEPGNFIDVWLQITNQRETIDDFTVTIEPEYPFSLSEDEAQSRNIASIPELSDLVLKYRVFVDLDARNQEYNLTWTYTWKDQGGIIHYDAPIYVQATDASLTIDHYTLTPIRCAQDPTPPWC